MPAERFYIDTEFSLSAEVSLQGAEHHHLLHVMRVRVGEEVELVNGRGDLASARFLEAGKKEAVLEVLKVERGEILKSGIVLAIPMMKMAKLEWIIEKGTELGADGFWLYPADYSEKKDLSEHQLERLNYIEISAMKQCGRLDLPELKIIDRFEELFSCQALFLFGNQRGGPYQVKKETPIVFITGPEKGFSDREREILASRGEGICLHRNTLRAETAPLAALCLLTRDFFIPI